MNIKSWLSRHGQSLKGKRIALFGATGGLGEALSRYILQLDGELIVVGRNRCKVDCLVSILQQKYPAATIHAVLADLEDMASVEAACVSLVDLEVDAVIHNAGAYHIPRHTCETGYDNVFQINFLAPYTVTRRLESHLATRDGRVVVVGSIAHNYAQSDRTDVDFSTRPQASLVYGNAKRYLMYATLTWAQRAAPIHVAVTHPGITLTNITAHYSPWLFALIKHPMKWIFMSPRKAALCVLQGLFADTPGYSWYGPRLFGVWGYPVLRPLKTADREEIAYLSATAESIYTDQQKQMM